MFLELSMLLQLNKTVRLLYEVFIKWKNPDKREFLDCTVFFNVNILYVELVKINAEINLN